jgi:DNA modification methylase
MNNLNLQLFSDVSSPAATTQSREEHLTFKANRDNGRHGWLRLTPAYSVHLVKELVTHCSQEDLALDPFCGSGTTALVCAQAGIPCHTIDINPFLVWLANAKCVAYSREVIEMTDVLLNNALVEVDDTHQNAWTPAIKDISKWWEPEILKLLAQVFEKFNNSMLPERVRFLLFMIFCRASIELATVSFGHQSMSFKKKISSSMWLDVPAKVRFRTVFHRVGTEVLLSANEPLQEDLAQAFLGDSRQLLKVLPYTNYTTVITSPPYPNRMSYIRELRPYMYWLGYLESGRQAGELDWQAIGGTWGCATSKLMSWIPDINCKVPFNEYDEVINKISQRSRVLGLYVAKYFEDVVQHIRSLKEVLVPGAKLFYVVGNSKFYDVMLHTEQIYAAIFHEEGFRDINIRTIRKRTSKKELFEYIVSART